jgi:linoleoyl-CoA desaturase
MSTGIKYERNTDALLFLKTLRQRVHNYFIENKISKYANGLVVFKTIFFLALFFISYILMISNQFSPALTFVYAVIFGLSSIFILFNISHDASHNALFKNRKINKLLSYTFNLVGGSGYMWNITHDKIHHIYPNVVNIDSDLNQSKPFLRVAPGTPKLGIHKFQHIYAPFLYSVYTIYLVFIKDFQDFGIISSYDGPLIAQNHRKKEYLILIASKVIYITYALLLPLLLLDFAWWKIILGYLAVNVLMSLLLLVVQLPLHINTDSSFAVVSEDNKIQKSWIIHTLENTTDYLAQSKIANFLFGGLNSHTIHHLFEGVCHVHYTELSRILETTADEYGIVYRNVTMGQAIKSHFGVLKILGNE